MLEDNLDVNLTFSEFLRGRVIGDIKDFSISDIELKQIKFIFEDDFKISTKFDFNEVKNIKIVDRNFFYDSYSFEYKDRTYLAKIGEEQDNYLFNREFKILKKIEEKSKLSPQGILNGIGKDYSYLITSYEYGNSIKEFGLSELYSRLDKLASCLKELHSNKGEASNLESYLEFQLDQSDFDVILDETAQRDLNKIKFFKKSKQILNELKETIKLQLKSFKDSNFSLCHMNLTESNILVRGSMMKFINFHNYFYVNPLWDLAIASINLGLINYPKLEEKLLTLYFKEEYDENCEAFPAYKDIVFKLSLHNLICNYYYKIITRIDKSSLFKMYIQYESIRPLIHNEFPVFLEVLDEMFGDFQKNI